MPVEIIIKKKFFVVPGEYIVNGGEDGSTGVMLKTYDKNGMSKIVEKYDLEGNFLERFNSLREAAESIGKDFKNISTCCRGITKSAYGFIWKYVGKSYKPTIKNVVSIEKRKKAIPFRAAIQREVQQFVSDIVSLWITMAKTSILIPSARKAV